MELIKFSGAEIIKFSPMKDKHIPKNSDFIYFGSGYPELYAEELSQNLSMKESIRKTHEKGVEIYGECGGFIYLTKKLRFPDGKKEEFCGLINVEISMKDRLNINRFGYINTETETGIKTKGHEFHYSEIFTDNEINERKAHF